MPRPVLVRRTGFNPTTSGHAVWDVKYHLIGITKYRQKVLRGEVAERARDLIRQICQAREVSIIRGAI